MSESSPKYYYTSDNNQVVGPLSYSQIIQLKQQGKIFNTTLVCKEGDTKWESLKSVQMALDYDKENRQQTIKSLPQKNVSVTGKASSEGKNKKDINVQSISEINSVDKFKIAHTALLAIIAILLIWLIVITPSSLPTASVLVDNATKDKSDKREKSVPVAILNSTTLPVSVTDEGMEYEYGAVYINRDDMFYAEKSHKSRNPDRILEPIEIPTYKLHIGGYKGWDYVGILCNDGINGSWILVRRKKEPKSTVSY